MKFKPNAATIAIYKVLGLVSLIMFIQAGIAFILCCSIIAIGNQETNYLAVVYMLVSVLLALIGDFLRTTRSEMIEK